MPIAVNVKSQAEAAVKRLRAKQIASVLFVVPFSNIQDCVTVTNIDAPIALELVRAWVNAQDAKAQAEQRVVRLN